MHWKNKLFFTFVFAVLLLWMINASVSAQTNIESDGVPSAPLTSPITSPEERFDFNEDGFVSLIDVQLLLQRLVEPIAGLFDTDSNGKTNSLDFGGIYGYLISLLPSPGASTFPSTYTSAIPSPQMSSYPTPRPSQFTSPRPTPSVAPR